MDSARTFLNFLLGGTLLGVLVASLGAPSLTVWYNTPALGPAQCDCALTTRHAADLVIRLQLAGGGVGAVLGSLLGGSFLWWMRPRPAPEAPPAT